MPVKRFCIWAALTFMSVFVLCLLEPQSLLSAGCLGLVCGFCWEIALRYLGEPDDWN